jgi:RimJ/RimL family protein N-acetyltransferase
MMPRHIFGGMRPIAAEDPMLGPTLETARLILRPPAAEDLDGWAAFTADPEAMRFLGGAQPRPVAWRHLCVMACSWSVNGFGMFSVVEKATGRWIGRLGPWRPEGWPGTEVGWGLAREAWGQGYAAEGARAATGWAFRHLGWTEVIHCIDAGNTPSSTLASRLGSSLQRDAVLPPPLDFTVQIWGQTRESWAGRGGM